MTQRHRGFSMTPVRTLLPALAGLALAALVAPAPAAARINYDGNWSVLIVTDSGSCDRGYRYGLKIRNGRVFYEGSASVNVDGRVSPNGQVQVRVWSGSQSASGYGRLASDYGSGRWRGAGSASSCSGTWTAERR
jgi:hypothetical protein